MYILITVAQPENAEADYCTRDIGLQNDMQTEAIRLAVVVPNSFTVFTTFTFLCQLN